MLGIQRLTRHLKMPGLGWEREGTTSHLHRMAVVLLLTWLLVAPQMISEIVYIFIRKDMGRS